MQLLYSRQVGQHRYKTEPVGTKEALVRGQPLTLSVREGKEEGSGRQVHQWIGLLNGKKGLVLLVIVGSLDTWDQAMAEQFIQSIK